MRKLPTRTIRERRSSLPKQRRRPDLLDVRVRAHIAAEQRSRRVMSCLCWLIVLGATGFGAFYGVRVGLRKLLWENPKYRVHEIAVSDDGALSRERVVAVSGVRVGESIFSVNLADSRERLEKISQIEHVDVQRIWPDKIEIAVSERKPVAWVTKDGGVEGNPTLLLDERGVLFHAENDVSSKADLPVISGVALDEYKLGETLNTLPVRSALSLLLLNGGDSHLQISNIDVSKGYCLVVSDRHHAQVLFGLENIDQQLERFSLLVGQIAPAQREEIRTVNLLVQRNIPVTFFADDAESANGDAGGSGVTAASAASSPLAKPEAESGKKATDEKRSAVHSKERTAHHRTETKRAVPVRRAQPVRTD